MLLSIVVLITGCARQEPSPLPQTYEFETVLQLRTMNAVAGEPFQVFTGLRNDSGQTWEIRHASPLIVVEIHASNWEELEPKVSLGTDTAEMLTSREMYDPDTANFLTGKRTLKLDQPGWYELVGIAHFRIRDPKTGEYREYAIPSQSVEMKVVSSEDSGTPDL